MRLVLILALLWLAANLVAFSGYGRARIEIDGQIVTHNSLPKRRAMCWHASPYVLGLEKAILEARRRGIPDQPVVVVFPELTSIYAAIAWHELFPLPVIALRNHRHLERVARETGAGMALVLFAEENQKEGEEAWRIVELGN